MVNEGGFHINAKLIKEVKSFIVKSGGWAFIGIWAFIRINYSNPSILFRLQ